jgi:hypothetical protein
VDAVAHGGRFGGGGDVRVALGERSKDVGENARRTDAGALRGE